MGNLLTPSSFWGGLGLYLGATEYSGFGYAGFIFACVPFLWARFGGTPIPTSRHDPLDSVMTTMAALLGAGAAASFMGYGLHFQALMMFLWAAAWAFAPSRSFPTGEKVTQDLDLSGKTAYITGPTSGIGTETARVLCLRGARVILASRSEGKLKKTKAEIEKSVSGAKVSILVVNLGDQESIRQSVKKLEEMNVSKIDILINNAGIMALPERRATAQGLEMQMGVNHVGHFLLTTLLTPLLKSASPSRVVCLSSLAHYYHDGKFFSHPKLECEPYNNWVAYGNSKMANIMFAKEYHRRRNDDGISAFSVHPGGIFTGLQGDVEPTTFLKWLVVAPFFFKSIAQGCGTTLHCATKPGIENSGGQYFDDCKPAARKRSCTEEEAMKLWEITEKLVLEH